ncbi:hypothetical protein BD560DRAFT_458314 [Blakeslea trispora]|nr:hypothetical protein BD560DRAFT_458314 [Blakeslea trispora]
MIELKEGYEKEEPDGSLEEKDKEHNNILNEKGGGNKPELQDDKSELKEEKPFIDQPEKNDTSKHGVSIDYLSGMYNNFLSFF